ncbi:MAG: DNA polymerase III subunit delta' [Chloroflexi bacterium]|nr:DNA polymerase III subunit delta' [Chloroflexota bacterium]
MQTNAKWNMLGHEWAVDLLRGQIANDRARHAYLFTGPHGVGRRSLALRLVQGLNCTQPPAPGEACYECRTCQHIEQMQHPDLAVVQAERVGGSLKVDQIRELQRGLALTPYEAKYRVALLLRFEEANPNAANALLKTLEEPPPQVVMMLTASDAESLLPTIVSRCEVIRLRPLPLDVVAAGLQTRWGLPPEDARLLAHISGGRPGYAINLHQNPETLKQRQTWLDDHQHLLGASRVERFAYAEELAKDKIALQGALDIWLSLWRDVMLRSAGASAPLTNPDREAEIEHLAAILDLPTAKGMVDTLERTQYLLDRYVNTRLTVEVLMLDLPRI